MEHWCELHLLGEFRLVHGGQQLAVWPSAQRLIAMMAVVHRDRRVRRTAIAERLWPDAAPGRATSSLRSVLWRLPRPRGRVLVHGNATTVWLDPGVYVDLWEAEELTHRLAASGPDDEEPPPLGVLDRGLLADWTEEWLLLEQESYRQKRLHALEDGADQLCRLQRYTDALQAGLTAVRIEPLRESAHRRVIAVHLAEGNHAEALRQYDGYRHLLADELGLRPSQSIRRLVGPLLGRPIDVPPP